MASIIDDYLTSYPDPLQSYGGGIMGGGGDPVELPFQSTTTKAPTTTVRTERPKYTEQQTITPESQTIANQTGGTQNWSETQKVINTDYKPETRDEFATRTGAKAVMERLQMQKPQPTGDPERMRKIAGVQAVGEALRNVVDAVYGARKARIDPHRSYTDNLLKQATNMDSAYAGQLKEYFKTLNDAEKKLTDDYLRKLMSEKDVAYNSKTVGGSNKTGQTITTTPEKIVTTKGKQTGGGSVSTETGGTSTTSGVRGAINYGTGAGETKSIAKEIKLPDGSIYVLDDKNLRLSADLASRYRGGQSYGEAGDALYQRISSGQQLSPDEYAYFVQSAVNTNPELAKQVADVARIQKTASGTGKMAGEVVQESMEPEVTPQPKPKTVSAYKNKSIKDKVKVPKKKKSTINLAGGAVPFNQ